MTDEHDAEESSYIPPSEEDLDKDHIYVKLTRPIKAYTDTLSVIKMRIPTGADAIRVGDPIDFNPFGDPPTVRFNMPLLQAMVARLANIPTGSIEKMAPNDLISCGWKLVPFFLPNLGT